MAGTVTIIAADVSLFHLAAAPLGNPLQWAQIAALNGRTDPWLFDLTAPILISLPAADPAQIVGLPATSA